MTRRVPRPLLLAVPMLLLLVAPMSAQETLDLFRYDPVRYFSATGARTWIGEARFMMTDYADTIQVRAADDGRSLRLRRTLVDIEDQVVVSRAEGDVIGEPGDTTFRVLWREVKYPEATGRMRFVEDSWTVFFDGEWSKWSIHIRRQDHDSFHASVARSVGSFAPVPLAGVVYKAMTAKGPSTGR